MFYCYKDEREGKNFGRSPDVCHPVQIMMIHKILDRKNGAICWTDFLKRIYFKQLSNDTCNGRRHANCWEMHNMHGAKYICTNIHRQHKLEAKWIRHSVVLTYIVILCLVWMTDQKIWIWVFICYTSQQTIRLEQIILTPHNTMAYNSWSRKLRKLNNEALQQKADQDWPQIRRRPGMNCQTVRLERLTAGQALTLVQDLSGVPINGSICVIFWYQRF